ncbi:hypothetical protein L6R53_19330 [Myxococcota bacterium]|nr:hypothetical protein [Myxococcota bacterium]
MRARHRLEIIRRVERPVPPPAPSLPVVPEPSWEEVMLSELTRFQQQPPTRARRRTPPHEVSVSWGPWDPDLDPGEEDTLDPMSGAA